MHFLIFYSSPYVPSPEYMNTEKTQPYIHASILIQTQITGRCQKEQITSLNGMATANGLGHSQLLQARSPSKL
jgi:hypothetical protein